MESHKLLAPLLRSVLNALQDPYNIPLVKKKQEMTAMQIRFQNANLNDELEEALDKLFSEKNLLHTLKQELANIKKLESIHCLVMLLTIKTSFHTNILKIFHLIIEIKNLTK